MISARDIIWGIVLPFLIAVVTTVAAHFASRKSRGVALWGVPIGIAGGFVVAYVAIVGRPAFPPREAQGWLMYLAMTAAAVSLIATAVRARAVVIWPLSIMLLFATARLLPKAESLESAFWPTVAIAAGAMLVWWITMERLASRTLGATLPFLLSGVAGVLALVLVDAGTQLVGQICGAVAVMLLAIAAVALWYRNLTLAHGGILITAVLLLGLLLCGHLYADVTMRDVILLAVAPLAAWGGEFLPARRPWLRFIVRFVLVFAIVALPLVTAAKGLKATLQEQMESTQY